MRRRMVAIKETHMSDATSPASVEHRDDTDRPAQPRSVAAGLPGWADRFRWLLFAGLAVFYLLAFNNEWRIGPDSAVHVVIARHLAVGEGYTHPTGLQDAVQPGLAYLTAATFRLGGVGRFVLIHLVMLLLAGGCLTLTYWMVRLRIDRPTAVVVTCMVALTETFYRYAFQVLTDMPFLFGVMLFLVGYELLGRSRRQSVAGVVMLVAGTAVMAAFRTVVLTFLAAVAAVVLWRIVRGPHRLRYAMVALAAVIALLVIRGLNPVRGPVWELGRDETRAQELLADEGVGMVQRVLTENLPTILTESVPEGVFAFDPGVILGGPLTVLLIGCGVALFRVRALWGWLVIAFAAQWLLFYTTDRYVLAILPLLALGWWRLIVWLAARPARAWAQPLCIGVLLLWVGPNVFYSVEFLFEQRSGDFYRDYERGRYDKLALLGELMPTYVGPDDVVIADYAHELVYYSGCRVLGPDMLSVNPEQRAGTLRMLRDAYRVWLVEPMGPRLVGKMQRLEAWLNRRRTVLETPGFRDDQVLRLIEVDVLPLRQRLPVVPVR